MFLSQAFVSAASVRGKKGKAHRKKVHTLLYWKQIEEALKIHALHLAYHIFSRNSFTASIIIVLVSPHSLTISTIPFQFFQSLHSFHVPLLSKFVRNLGLGLNRRQWCALRRAQTWSLFTEVPFNPGLAFKVQAHHLPTEDR